MFSVVAVAVGVVGNGGDGSGGRGVLHCSSMH